MQLFNFDNPKLYVGREISFIIPGEAVAKQSTNFNRVTGHAYTDAKVKGYSNRVASIAYDTMGNKSPIDGMVEAHIIFYHQVQELKNKQRLREDRLLEHEMCMVKPDWDNIAKNICDACEKIVYTGDQKIVQGHVTKLYAEKPYTVVGFRELLPLEVKKKYSRVRSDSS